MHASALITKSRFIQQGNFHNSGYLKNLWVMAILLTGMFSFAARADNFDTELLAVQEDWAEINYQANSKDKIKAFEALSVRADQMIKGNPKRPEPLIWRAIILSTWAGAKGGLGALSLVKEAKSLLEKSLAINEKALDGSAHTSLGSLYYQVPGWPIGFGNDEKARKHLQAALALNPSGIDSNYFYGDFLMAQGKFAEARSYMEKALHAPERPNRPIADAGRRDEVKQKLAAIAKESQ